MYWLCLGVLVVMFWVAHAVRTGRPGRAMVAQRDNELAAEAYGMSTTRTRLTAFGLSGAIASVAGCLLIHLLQTYPGSAAHPRPQPHHVQRDGRRRNRVAGRSVDRGLRVRRQRLVPGRVRPGAVDRRRRCSSC